MRNYEIGIESYNELVALVEKKISADDQLAKIYELCAEALKSYNGKVIDCRLEKAIIPGYKIRYYKYYDMPQINIWQEYKDQDGEIQHRQHYNVYLTKEKGANQRLDINFLKDKAKSIKEQAAADRIKAEKICETVNMFNSALYWYKKAQDELCHIPHFYEWHRY